MLVSGVKLDYWLDWLERRVASARYFVVVILYEVANAESLRSDRSFPDLLENTVGVPIAVCILHPVLFVGVLWNEDCRMALCVLPGIRRYQRIQVHLVRVLDHAEDLRTLNCLKLFVAEAVELLNLHQVIFIFLVQALFEDLFLRLKFLNTRLLGHIETRRFSWVSTLMDHKLIARLNRLVSKRFIRSCLLCDVIETNRRNRLLDLRQLHLLH